MQVSNIQPTSTKQTMENPKIAIIGYYGASEIMTYDTYEKLVEECQEIIEKDFGLDISKCHFVANGGSWTNHLPVTLAKRTSNRITFVFPRPWSEASGRYYNRNAENLNPIMKKLAGQMTSSHELMKKRLQNKIDSRSEINEFIKGGCEYIEKQNIKLRDETVQELCEYLIFIPLNDKKTTNARYGQTIFDSFKGTKRSILLSEIFDP